MKKLAILLSVFALVLAGTGVSAAPRVKPKVYSPSQTIGQRCAEDIKAKGTAADIQFMLSYWHACVGPSRVVNSPESKLKPKLVQSSEQEFLDLEACKLKKTDQIRDFRGFPNPGDIQYLAKKHPAAGSVIQVIGISGTDAPAVAQKPSEAYKFYLDGLKNWFYNVNNSGSAVTVRVSDKWYDFGEKLAPLDISHFTYGPKTQEFAGRVLKLADPDVNFSDVGYVIVVPSPSVGTLTISQSHLGQGHQTAERVIENISLVNPANFEIMQASYPLGFSNLVMWIHELYHSGFSFGDQNGDGKWHRLWQKGPAEQSEIDAWDVNNRGMGEWGMFANGTTDMLQWQKWLLNFTTDSQVACAPLDKATTTWLAPGSTKSSKRKLLVVPISNSEAIAVESVRATGLNYKLASYEQGALIYTIDMTDTRYDFGYTVQFPDSRKWKSIRHSMDTAPFKKGESITYKGVKITNVEWGDFGDVIKVEPATK